jgi:menaquinone-dependent protoporphyrinogen IX oxidase
MRSVLIVYDTVDGHTHKIAQAMGDAVKNDGGIVDLVNLRQSRRPWKRSVSPSVYPYDAVVIGGPIRYMIYNGARCSCVAHTH